ncbi:sporulation and spore germination protein [Pseudonocardia hierapolitana]|uniref:Sporulation and spore germination protein n=1 Tax=Pseudonocardia hierapolitana TaxID=1128676 RepID=A0A561SSW6_9PSEU|nr:Gmad2 immunoglobulin-like domain-containing protein [Pseudonocardia hierapolitana]TWF77957.1 sporulation and spore germination protein [Pseudonocardia hierapolitana]
MARQMWALVLLTLVAGCGGPTAEPVVPSSGTPETSTSAAPSTSPSLAPSSTSTPDAGERVAVPVYYVAETPAGFRLQREFHSVVTSDPASAAVREMLAGPTGADPDYRTYWPPGSALREPVHREGGAIVVDLGGVGPTRMGTELAEVTVQQLVFTVQGALQSTDPVRLLVDGAPAHDLWGAVDLTAPVGRGDPYAVRSLVQIDSPADGARVGREVEVRGEAAVFEATVLWEVLRDGELVQKGVASTAEGQRFAPFAFTVTLEPGEYTLRIREDDPSGGEGRPVLSDDKRITVA